MEDWEILTSIIISVAIFVIAAIIHAMNKWKRWDFVESGSLKRISTITPQNEGPALECVRYESSTQPRLKNAPFLALISPDHKYQRMLDQYATGLCLAGIPVGIIKWERRGTQKPVDFAQVASQVEKMPDIAPTGIVYLIYRTVAADIAERVTCAAKNPRNRWILVCPEIAELSQWEIFGGNGKNMHVMYALDAPRKSIAPVEALIAHLQIPDQNIVRFPTGKRDLTREETIALGKIISWIIRITESGGYNHNNP